MFEQGGPQPELETSENAYFLPKVFGNDKLFLLPYQAQTLSPDEFMRVDITFEQAKIAAAESTRILGESIEILKEAGKTVFVVGVSYGAFVATDQIATFGPTADAYLIVVGRLDIPEQVWRTFADGRPVGFVDGQIIVEVPLEAAGMGADSAVGDRNMMRLAAGLEYKRFRHILADTGLSNVSWLFGTQDEQVGKLSEIEISFLTARGATVIAIDDDHGGTISSDTFGVLARKINLNFGPGPVREH